MGNVYPLLREACVTSVEDPESLGRIQLRVLPELSEHEEADLPWCFPEDSGIHGKDFGMPQIGQLVSCIVWTKFWCEITYLPFVIRKPADHLYKRWMDTLRSKLNDMQTDPEEKNLVVRQFADDFSEFHDVGNSEHGILHPSGTYVSIDREGSVWMKCVKELHIHDASGSLDLKVDLTTGDITLKSAGALNVNSEGKINIKTSSDCNIDSDAKMNIRCASACRIEASSEATIQAPRCTIDSNVINFTGVKSQGSIPPTGAGVLCGIPACICSGTPHIG